MDTGMPSNNEDTPMQNEESTVTSQTWTTASSSVTNGPGLSLFRSPNLPPTHFILLKTPVSGGAITTENCFVVDISNLQSQNITLVPAITQATVKPPTEEQDSKERVQNYIKTLSLPSSSQTGSLNVDDNQSFLSSNCVGNGTLTQISNNASSQPGATGGGGVNGAVVRNGDLGDVVVGAGTGASSVQAQQTQQGQISTAALDISSSSGIAIDAESLASAFIQQTGQTASAVIATAGAVTQGAIITNNTQSMVNVLTNSAVVTSGGILVTGSGELDYRSSHGGITGCGGVASYSNVTSPSICTSPSDDDQMDGTNDFVSSDNEDISDINRSLIQSGNLEKGATGSGPNSGNVTPGGSIDFINYQQLNMANGLSGDLPTMVLKGDHEHNASGEITTISSDSYSDSGGAGGTGFVQTRSKRMYDSSSSCPISMYSRNTLIAQFPSTQEGVTLSVVNQPESRHRPRYLTEGSRGSVKDRSGNGYPSVKLTGFTQCPLTLQVFIGTDTGRPKPHGFFQACRVTGRNVISCLERNIDGTQIMEIDLDPKNDMKVDIDCIGILKLRNADVEAMESTTRSKKKSQRARMVFRVSVPRSDGSSFTLQTMSDTIQCSQPTGQPEIVRLTTDRSPACGGGITYVLGKHFTRPVVTFSRKGPLNGNASATGNVQPPTAIGFGAGGVAAANTVAMTPATPKVAPLFGATGGTSGGGVAGGAGGGAITSEETWSEVAELLNDCISQHYVGCKIPAYCNGVLNQPVYCEVTVTNGDNKVSDPAVFIYTPNEEAPTLQAILSLPNSTWTACPIASVSSAGNSVLSEMQTQLQHSIVTTSAAGGGIGATTITTTSSTSTACYSSSNNAKRSRTCQPETEVMEQSPGSSSNGGPVASDSGSSLHSKMAPVSNICGGSTQNVTPVQFNPATLVAAVNQTSMNVSSSTYNSQSLMNLQPLVAKPVPGIIPALNNSQNHQDPSKAHFILPGGTSVLQIQQNGTIKTATINPSQPICSTILQNTGHQQVTNVSYSGVEILGSLPSNLFIKPENETPTCSKSVIRSNAGPAQYPVVMPRGMMTNVAPSQSSLPHPPVMGNTMSALNFKLPPPTPQNTLLTGGSDQTMLPSIPTSVPNVANPTPQTASQFIQPNTANNSASQSQVPMEITKIPPPSQPQPQQQQQPTQSIPQQPPSDSPMSGSTITNPASVGSDNSSSAATTSQTTSTTTASATPDINSILKGLLLIGAQSANPSAYAEFALQIANQIQKDGAEAGSGSSNSNPPASMEANSTCGFNSQSPVAASTSVANSVTETISSVNPINTTLTALPSSSMNNSITTAVQQLSNVPPVGNQQSVQQLSQPVSSNEMNTNFQHQATTAPPSHVPSAGVTGGGSQVPQQLSQTAQLTAAAIAKNPELAPFAPHLISAVEAVQQQSLNAASRDPNQKEQLLQQLQLLLQQEAIKLASLAEAQQQQGQASSNQQQPPQQQQQAGANQSFNYIITPSQNSQTQLQTQSLTQTPSESMTQQPIIVPSTAQQFPMPLQQASQSLHRPVSISSSQQMQQAPLNIQQNTNVVATPQLQHIVSGSSQPTMESLQQNQQAPQKALIGSNVTPSTPLSSNNHLYFQVQSVVPQTIPPGQQQAMNNQNVGQASQPQQNVFQSSAQQQPPAQQQQSSAPMINQSMLAAQQLQMQQQTSSLQQQPQPTQPQQQQPYPQMFLLQQVEPQHNATGTRKLSTEYAQSSCSGDQTPLSVQSANPPSVQSAPSSNLSSHSYELNSPFQSPGTCGSLQQSQNPPQVTPQTSMSQCIPSSVSQVTPPQQKQLPPPSAMPVNSIPSSSTASYVVYSQTPTCASVAATSISQSMFYSMSQSSGSEMHCSNMDLSDPDLYSTHNQNQHVVQQTTSNAGQPEMADENMFKEPYPVNNSSSVDWQTQRNSTTQFSNTSLNDLSHQHQVLQQQQQQHSSMSWEPNAGSHSSMTWESTSGNSNSTGSMGNTASIHQPSSMKSSTTDPFLSSGQLENNSVQQASSLMDIHQASTFEHDQNSQSSSISSSEMHEFDLLSQIAQSPLCAILSNDSLFAPSPAPVVTPEEPPARGAAVLKYLIEKGFIDGEQRNIVTAEAIESAICELSKQKPITEITFEDVVSVLFGSKNG